MGFWDWLTGSSEQIRDETTETVGIITIAATPNPSRAYFHFLLIFINFS